MNFTLQACFRNELCWYTCKMQQTSQTAEMADLFVSLNWLPLIGFTNILWECMVLCYEKISSMKPEVQRSSKSRETDESLIQSVLKIISAFYTVQFFIQFFFCASVWRILIRSCTSRYNPQSVALHLVWSFLSDILVFDYIHILLFLIYSCSIVVIYTAVL